MSKTFARIQVRRDTAANWTFINPVLSDGEPAYETDSGREKTGDGATAWIALPYKPVLEEVALLSSLEAEQSSRIAADTALQNNLNSKEDEISTGTTSQYWRGDKSWQTLDKSAVGLSNVDNTADANKPVSTAQQAAIDSKENAFSKNSAFNKDFGTGTTNIGKYHEGICYLGDRHWRRIVIAVACPVWIKTSTTVATEAIPATYIVARR